MKTSFAHGFVRISLAAALTASTAALAADSPDTKGGFKGPIGLQLYSLRAQFAKDVPGTLDEVKSFGIKYAELAGTYGQPPEKFKEALEERGIQPISAHFPYEKYRDSVESVVKEAKALGLKYAGCAWIPHMGAFTEKQCRETATVFNKAGEALGKEGIKFFYHTHGYEFEPQNDGTLFDLLMSETDPKKVSYEMDIFWIVHPGQDPVKLLKKYSNRWELMHVKDMRKGTPTGMLTGSSPVTNDVTVGTGQIDIPSVLKAAQEIGVKWYFLEDESPTSEQQIPQSLKYLQEVRF